MANQTGTALVFVGPFLHIFHPLLFFSAGVLNQYNIRETCLDGQNPNQNRAFVTGHANNDPQAPLIATAIMDAGEGAGASAGAGAGAGSDPMHDDPCDLGSIQLINWMNRKDVQVLVGGTF